MPFMIVLPAKLPPMIFTTRTLSTLKLACLNKELRLEQCGDAKTYLAGMTIMAASATSLLSISSFPYCFDEMTGFIACCNEVAVTGDGSEEVESSGKRQPGSSHQESEEVLTIQLRQSFRTCELVSLYYIIGVQSHHDETLRLFQKFTSKDYDKICSVSHLQP
jgi:hypothetical protein